MNHLHTTKTPTAASDHDPSRRSALQRGLAGVAGAAMFWMVHPGARAADNKLAKAAVQYVDQGSVAGKDCDDCIHFLPGPTARDPATCRIVEGTISPHGNCLAFSPRR